MAYPSFVFMLGFSFLMAIITLFKSALNHWERANLYCALTYSCIFLNCLLILIDIDLGHYGFLSAGGLESTPGLWFNLLTPVCMLFFYRDFLMMNIQSPRFYWHFSRAAYGLLVCVIAIVVLTFLPQYAPVFQGTMRVFQLSLLVVFAALPLYCLRFWRHPIYRYAAWSSWSIIGFYSCFLLTSLTGLDRLLPLWIADNFLFVISIIDGILFWLALTTRERQLLVEKMQLEQQSTLNELRALRSQMNPHFIFNSLNAIKAYNLTHDADRTDFYLTKFSKLIRRVLENARAEKITLDNELETLTLYLEMESLRADDKLTYVIEVEEELEPDFVEIPPMLIQPYVENAIWHGLMHKMEGGKVTIAIHQPDPKTPSLQITIVDNGVGRVAAAALYAKTTTRPKSFGMKITAERLGRLGQLRQREADVVITDLQNPDGTAAGTKVTLTVPL
jgi:hypothetical protein